MSRSIVSAWDLAVLQKHLEELFDALTLPSEAPSGGWTPAVDLVEGPGALIVRADLPGVARRDIEVAIGDRELQISGAKAPSDHAAAQRRCHRVERSFGPFSVRVHLPVPVDTAACRATLRQGVLEITLPRLLPSPGGAHRIEVSEEEP